MCTCNKTVTYVQVYCWQLLGNHMYGNVYGKTWMSAHIRSSSQQQRDKGPWVYVCGGIRTEGKKESNYTHYFSWNRKQTSHWHSETNRHNDIHKVEVTRQINCTPIPHLPHGRETKGETISQMPVHLFFPPSREWEASAKGPFCHERSLNAWGMRPRALMGLWVATSNSCPLIALIGHQHHPPPLSG